MDAGGCSRAAFLFGRLIGPHRDVAAETHRPSDRAAGGSRAGPASVASDARGPRPTRAEILPVVVSVCPELFTARELVEHDSADLRLVLSGLTPKRLGRLLQRAEGQPVGEFVVQRDGLEVGAILWRVLAAS